MDTINLTLNGRTTGPDPISAGVLAEALGQLQSLANALGSEKVTALPIRDISLGSVVVVTEAPAQVVESVDRGLRSLETHREPPSGWNSAALEAIGKLAGLPGTGGVTGVSLGSTVLTSRIAEPSRAAAAVLARTRARSFGAVEGRLYAYSARSDQRTAKLDDSRGYSVSVAIPTDALAAQMRQLLETQGRVLGLVERDSDDPSRVYAIEAQKVTSVADTTPPSAEMVDAAISEGRAAWAALGGEGDPVQLVKAVRYGK